jgi:DNA-directed RNA polymerase specialized sigma24 family protein
LEALQSAGQKPSSFGSEVRELRPGHLPALRDLPPETLDELVAQQVRRSLRESFRYCSQLPQLEAEIRELFQRALDENRASAATWESELNALAREVVARSAESVIELAGKYVTRLTPAWCTEREDLTQEVCQVFFRAEQADLVQPAHWKAFLIGVVRKVLKNATRKHWRRFGDRPTGSEPDFGADPGPLSDALVESNRRLDEALRELDAGCPVFKQIVLLRVEGKTFQEIAQELCATVDGVKSRFYREGRKLAVRLGKRG